MSTTRIALIEAYQAAIISIAKRDTLSKARSAVSAAERAAGTGCVYTWGASTKADFLEYCEIRIADLVAHDHAEALAENARRTFAALPPFSQAVAFVEAHAEALEMDKQATHFRKEQAALTQRVAAIMGKSNAAELNTAPV